MHQPTLISTKPTFENCDPFTKYQKYTPNEYSFQELPILFGGGRKWILKTGDPHCFQQLPLNYHKDFEIDLFVLNIGLIIWFNEIESGVQIPYSCIISNSVRMNEMEEMELFLQVTKPGSLLSFDGCINTIDELSTVEVSFIPMFGISQRYYNDQIERLFTYEYFGLNKGEKMIMNSFNAISKCTNLYAFSDDENDQYSLSDNEDMDDQDMNIDNQNFMMMDFQTERYNNSGNADDINLAEYQMQKERIKVNIPGGIEVDIYNNGNRGIVRGLDEESQDGYTFKKVKF
ncbi:hypothetical protein WICMUC_002816 [Wickerhamomyces mucosus]|uniref:Protein LOT5 n=1 Tax=Wickerhamomyces mucosus TaxID=1378264 RepID=A0A9P8PP89_9ASCO|nr:hypothetical protein WICMUC_002816 [Wickerhamomyces mucosus]